MTVDGDVAGEMLELLPQDMALNMVLLLLVTLEKLKRNGKLTKGLFSLALSALPILFCRIKIVFVEGLFAGSFLAFCDENVGGHSLGLVRPGGVSSSF
jgi:hypothetical protein